jgi:hypothetical protein
MKLHPNPTRRIAAVMAAGGAWLGLGPILADAAADVPRLVVCSVADNDLVRILSDNGIRFARFEDAAQAVREAPSGAGVLILADRYPTNTTQIEPAVFAQAAGKNLRLYVEYPASLPQLEVGKPRAHKKGVYGSNLEREVVTSDAFGATLRKNSIIMVQGCRYVPVAAPDPHLVVAHVAGYNQAVFGLPDKDVWPILFEHPDGNLLVATTKLSHFVTGRYAPVDAWGAVWRMILGWLQPDGDIPELKWTPAVRPSYGRAERLPADAELAAFKRGVDWFGGSKLFIEPSGKQGFHEGYNSKDFFMDGSHGISGQVRGDCTGEVAMSLALGAALTGNDAWRGIATNLLDLLYFESVAARGPRLDPQHPAYGLIGGDLMVDSGVYYGDDSARHLLGTMAAAAVLQTDRWNERAVMEMLADFRTTGPWGFRKARIDEPELVQQGWRRFWEKSDGRWGGERLWPHYEAYLWATLLWLYDKTHFEPLLRRTERGIRLLMDAFPDGWGSEANRHETERCRMLLPLAWLLRVEDTPEHREWLRQIKQYVLAAQHASGAIRQRVIHETTANSQYGTGECALIQANGDPACDLLYAVNFAFLGLHEAAAATRDPELAQAADRLADFLVRIQIRSESRPELDGAWYRGFDFQKWEYWGSDGDIGWGVWCIETGWTQTWITTTLGLRHLRTSLWDLMAGRGMAEPFARHRPAMLPDDALEVIAPVERKFKHAALGKPVRLAAPPHKAYAEGGPAALTNGRLPSLTHERRGCLGFEGIDAEATVDLRQTMPIRSLAAHFLQDVPAGIYLPRRVDFAVSVDGATFQSVDTGQHQVSPKEPGPLTWVSRVEGLNCEARYVRLRASNIGQIPAGHPAAGAKAWLFVDEVLVNPEALP